MKNDSIYNVDEVKLSNHEQLVSAFSVTLSFRVMDVWGAVTIIKWIP